MVKELLHLALVGTIIFNFIRRRTIQQQKRIDEKERERETEQNNQKKQIYK